MDMDYSCVKDSVQDFVISIQMVYCIFYLPILLSEIGLANHLFNKALLFPLHLFHNVI